MGRPNMHTRAELEARLEDVHALHGERPLDVEGLQDGSHLLRAGEALELWVQIMQCCNASSAISCHHTYQCTLTCQASRIHKGVFDHRTLRAVMLAESGCC